MGTMVYVGTGEMLGVGDLSSTAVQSVYGIFDPPTSSAPPPTRLNLVQQYLGNNTAVSGTPVRVVCGTTGAAAGGCDPNTTGGTPNQVKMPTPDRGWFVDLVSQYDGAGNEIPSGERVITDPQLEVGGGVVMTTYQPNPSTCTGGGSAWLMVFNYATGGSFPLPEFDTNSDFTLNSQDATAAGANPVAMYLGPVYASMPALLPAGMNGAAGTIKQIAVSSNNVDSILDRGGAKQRINWWEVRH
jgi:type IV pilus assembly protein PilY1